MSDDTVDVKDEPRPDGCKFWTVRDVTDWIALNVNLGHDESPEAAAMWWLACRHAESIRDMGFRELARLCLDGLPSLEFSDLEDEIRLWWEGDPIDRCNSEIESNFRYFFRCREVK